MNWKNIFPMILKIQILTLYKHIRKKKKEKIISGILTYLQRKLKCQQHDIFCFLFRSLEFSFQELIATSFNVLLLQIEILFSIP